MQPLSFREWRTQIQRRIFFFHSPMFIPKTRPATKDQKKFNDYPNRCVLWIIKTYKYTHATRPPCFISKIYSMYVYTNLFLSRWQFFLFFHFYIIHYYEPLCTFCFFYGFCLQHVCRWVMKPFPSKLACSWWMEDRERFGKPSEQIKSISLPFGYSLP